jgi:hypothetical protein
LRSHPQINADPGSKIAFAKTVSRSLPESSGDCFPFLTSLVLRRQRAMNRGAPANLISFETSCRFSSEGLPALHWAVPYKLNSEGYILVNRERPLSISR